MNRPISDIRRRLKRAQATQLDRMFKEIRRHALRLWIEYEFRAALNYGSSDDEMTLAAKDTCMEQMRRLLEP